ncbi:MAG: gliding motility lipoprotein GldD [Cyclobacteriaceae bacterium]
MINRIQSFKIIKSALKIFKLIIFLLFISCTSDYMPKPKGYNRIELPDHEYVGIPDTLPYYFEISKLARLNTDTTWTYMNKVKEQYKDKSDLTDERYWIDLIYDTLLADIQITYKPIYGRQELMKEYFSDSYKLTSQHQIKAYAIDEIIMITKNGYAASIAEISGEVPSQIQFVTTDSLRHFMRGALYFKTATQNDSLAPAIQYIKNDIIHLLNTLQWRNR